MERIPQDFSKNPRCWTTHLVKLKIYTNGQMLDAPKGGCKLYGRIILLAYQPKEGTLWQEHDQMMQTVRATHRLVITNAQVNVPG